MITPQKSYPDLARAVGVSSLYLKREDLHPYGSHKGRSLPVMIDHYLKEGKRHFAISSSGNAALAAALYVKELNGRNDENIKLEILVGNHILDKKLKKLTDLADDNVSVMRFERPLQSLTQKTADGSIQSLRQSIDDTALLGYESLAKELEGIKDLQAIFVATSSGTTAQALAEYFIKNAKRKMQSMPSTTIGGANKKPVEIHIVQTTSCHPMALEFVDSVVSEEQSAADAIVDMTAHRKNALIPLIKKTNGSGWIASNEEIRTAQELMGKHAKIIVSPNGALALAGLMQAVFTGKEWSGAVMCVVGGE
jgi:threonine dehydratase